MLHIRGLATIVATVILPGALAQAPEATKEVKSFVWHDDPECCTQENRIMPTGVAINSKTISDYGVGFCVFANAYDGSVRFRLGVNASKQIRVYALSRATLVVQGKTIKPVDADKRIRSIQRDGAIRGVFTAIHGAKSTSDVDIQDKTGRTVGTATVTTRDDAETQRQLDRINRETALATAGYANLLRDYDALPGSAPWGDIQFEAKIKRPTTATFQIQIGDTIYVLPFDLAASR